MTMINKAAIANCVIWYYATSIAATATAAAKAIGADTALKLGDHNTQIFLACPSPILHCAPPQSRGHSGGSEKTDIVKITRIKNKALLTWRLADIHDVSHCRIHQQKF